MGLAVFCQPTRGNKRGCRVAAAPLHEGFDYSPSVTLALKIAKICNAKVEDIFRYEEEVSEDER